MNYGIGLKSGTVSSYSVLDRLGQQIKKDRCKEKFDTR